MAFDQSFQSLPSALTILTSMITPALLISATGTFILSTSNRLGRVVDRVRAISEKMDNLMHGSSGLEMIDERKANRIVFAGDLNVTTQWSKKHSTFLRGRHDEQLARDRNLIERFSALRTNLDAGRVRSIAAIRLS